MEKTDQYTRIKLDILHRYEKVFGVRLDDESLYIILAIHDLNTNLNKRLKQFDRPLIKSKWELFLFNAPKVAVYLILLLIIALQSLVILKLLD